MFNLNCRLRRYDVNFIDDIVRFFFFLKGFILYSKGFRM